MSRISEIIDEMENLGYRYCVKRWPNGTAMTYKFELSDKQDPKSSWIISIEDHHGEPDIDDWLIYCCYHDPEQKDWDGIQIDIGGAVEFKAMKLIIEFIEELYGGGIRSQP